MSSRTRSADCGPQEHNPIRAADRWTIIDVDAAVAPPTDSSKVSAAVVDTDATSQIGSAEAAAASDH